MVWTSPKALWGLIEESVKAWNDDYAPSMGAALAYYTLFSVAPLLIIVIAVAGLVFGQDAARGAIFAQLQGLIGDEGAAVIEGLVKSANKPATSTIATIVGIATTCFAATARLCARSAGLKPRARPFLVSHLVMCLVGALRLRHRRCGR